MEPEPESESLPLVLVALRESGWHCTGSGRHCSGDSESARRVTASLRLGASEAQPAAIIQVAAMRGLRVGLGSAGDSWEIFSAYDFYGVASGSL